MSTADIRGVKLHYEKYGSHGRDVVLLHGWGQNTEMMAYRGRTEKPFYCIQSRFSGIRSVIFTAGALGYQRLCGIPA